MGWAGGEGQHLMARVSSYKKVHCTVLIGVGDRIANHNGQHLMAQVSSYKKVHCSVLIDSQSQ